MAVRMANEGSIRRALGRAVALGPRVLDDPQGHALRELPAFHSRLEELGPGEESKVFRQVLEESIERLDSSQQRVLLRIVLGLEPGYEDSSAAEKRAAAGEKFRGGRMQVMAGTIRQYHEPKAIAALASTLVSERGRDSSVAVTGSKRVLEWHPATRVNWGHQRLMYWRLRFDDYRASAMAVTIKEILEGKQVQAWSLFETFGESDLLLRLWLPPETPTIDFERALVDAFGARLELADYFLVDDILAEWPWSSPQGMREPDQRLLSSPPPALLPDDLTGGIDSGLLAEFEDQNLVANVTEETSGVGFVLLVDAPQRISLSPAERASVEERLMLVCDEVPDVFSRISLYRGAGFADYMIRGMVRADAFAALRDSLLGSIDRALQSFGYRTTTIPLARPQPLAEVSNLPFSVRPRSRPAVKELLARAEGAELEFRGFALSDWQGQHDRKVAEALAKTIVAFLNSDGGTIVLGAFEKEAIQSGRGPSARPELVDAPQVGRCLLVGIDREIEEDEDRFLRRLRDFVTHAIAPDPSAFVDLELTKIEERTVCLVTIRIPKGLREIPYFYFLSSPRGRAQFMIRAGATNRELVGPDADTYKIGLGTINRLSVRDRV